MTPAQRRNAAGFKRRCDAVAEYVAEHDCLLKDAGVSLGIQHSGITRVWRRIKADLGWQAS